MYMATQAKIGIVSGLETITKSLVIVSVVVGLGMVAITGLGSRIAAGLIVGANPSQDWQVTIGGTGWNQNLPSGATSLTIGTKPGYTDGFDWMAGTLDRIIPPLPPTFTNPDVYSNRTDWVDPRAMGDVRAPLVAGVDKTWNIKVSTPVDYSPSCDDSVFNWGSLAGLPSDVSLTLRDNAYSPARDINMKTIANYSFCSTRVYTGSNRFQITAHLATGTSVPTVTLTATPAAITVGGSTTLTWSSTNATRCIGSGAGLPMNSTVSGSVTVNPTTTTTYSMVCLGAGGSGRASVTVTVNPAVANDWYTTFHIAMGQPSDPIYPLSQDINIGTRSTATDGFDEGIDELWTTGSTQVYINNRTTDIRGTIGSGSSNRWDISVYPANSAGWSNTTVGTFTSVKVVSFDGARKTFTLACASCIHDITQRELANIDLVTDLQVFR